MSSPRFAGRLIAAAALAAAAPAALAANVFELRVLDTQANWTTRPDDASTRLQDWFADGDLQSGLNISGFTPINPPYAVSGSLPAMTVPGDFSFEGQAVGQVTFAQATATAPAPVNVNGSAFVDQNNRLTLRGNNLNAGLRNFAASSAWNFVAPDANTRYGMRLTDSFGAAFDDVIGLELVRMGSGATGVQMRRLSGDGLGNVTTSQTQTIGLTSGLYSGFSLADVNLVSLHMYWSPGSGVWGDMEMLRIADGGADVTQVGAISFSNRYGIFHGESITRLQVGASWSAPAAPVPEPATLGMMAAGLAALGVRLRRRCAG